MEVDLITIGRYGSLIGLLVFIAVIVMMTFLIAAADLTHVIAGSVDVFYGVLASEVAFIDSVNAASWPVRRARVAMRWPGSPMTR